MIYNIKQNVKTLSYPSFDIDDGKLTDKQIISAIELHGVFVAKFELNDRYYAGNNSYQLGITTDNNAPANKIVAPYARTMNQTLVGYMFKPNNITYKPITTDGLDDRYKEVMLQNTETVKNSEMGEDQGKYGIGFQLFWNNDIDGKIVPMFSRVNPKEVIPIYNHSIDKSLIAAVRYYEADNDTKTKRVEVYYSDRVDYYDLDNDNLKYKDSIQHFYKIVPLVTYINNQQYIADYEPVQSLIDLFDKMLSDAANELDRFAAAYMILKNFILAENDVDAQRKLETMKAMRVFEIRGDGEVSFLTKDIPSEFFDMMKQTLREEIEFHSHIPDFRSKSFDAKSGEALKMALTDFENLASQKEAYFKQGLLKRNVLINNILGISKQSFNNNFEIVFKRNLPISNSLEADIVQKLSGIVSKQTLLSYLSNITDIDAELELIKQEIESSVSLFDSGEVIV